MLPKAAASLNNIKKFNPEKSIIHSSKNLIFRVREQQSHLFYIQPLRPKAATLATVIYFERST
jgi:hypothetical protein